MAFDKRQRLVVVIAAAVVAAAVVFVDRAGLFSAREDGGNIAGERYVDPQRGISLVLPADWVADTDESGDLYVYRQDPYLTVTFRRYTAREEWQRQAGRFAAPTAFDVVTDSAKVEVGGYPATRLVVERRVAGAAQFRYVEYFVDGGVGLYEISGADPDSEEVARIVRSVQF
jgi:hypothetical protein